MQEGPVAFIHAQVKMVLADSCRPFVAIRPDFLASDNFKHNLDTSGKPWEAVLMRNQAAWDNIPPLGRKIVWCSLGRSNIECLQRSCIHLRTTTVDSGGNVGHDSEWY